MTTRCENKIPTDKIPMDKIPTTGFRCGCPDFLDLYMHARFGPMVHVYIHTITMQSCLIHPTILCCFILLLTETQILTIWCQSGIFICAQQCNSSLHSPSDHCHPGSRFSHLVHCALSLGATCTLLILILLMFPLNLDGSNYR